MMIEFIKILTTNLIRGVIPGALVIVYKKVRGQTKFLIIKSLPSRSVSFPGGSISWWETLEDTAKRELYEETGIIATKLRKLPIVHRFRYRQLPLKPKGEQWVFAFQIEGKEKIKLSLPETEWIRWLSARKAERLFSHRELSQTFKKSLRYL